MKLARSLVRGSGLIAALAVLGFLTWIVVRSPFLDIKTIEVRGPVEASGLQEVTRTVEGALSGNILTADICAVKQAVEGIAWVKSAYVSRLWPDSLYIEVKRIGARVKAVKATFRGSWSVVLESPQFDSMEIELGRALTQGGPINRLRQVLDSMDRVVAMLKAYPERIDARYKNAFAVQLPPQAYVAAQTNPADKTAKPATNSSKTRGR